MLTYMCVFWRESDYRERGEERRRERVRGKKTSTVRERERERERVGGGGRESRKERVTPS